jgi:hypothetical protein
VDKDIAVSLPVLDVVKMAMLQFPELLGRAKAELEFQAAAGTLPFTDKLNLP